MSAADTGADQRAMAALQATVKDLSARLVQLEARVDALEESGQPSPEVPPILPVDPHMPSEADRVAMRERLRAGTLAGIEANKKDSTRAGRTYRREGCEVT